MPGRKYSAGNAYRYGFNGKENDNEVKGEGNQLDYGMRIYDPRIGRFLSVDPLTKSYSMLTPFQFSSNSPIANIDLDGLEKIYYTLIWNDKSKAPILKVDKVETHSSFLGLFSIKNNLSFQVHYEGGGVGNKDFTFGQFGGGFDVSIDNSIQNFETWLANPLAYQNPVSGKTSDFGDLFVSDNAVTIAHLTTAAASVGGMANSFGTTGKSYTAGFKNKQVLAAHGDNEQAVSQSVIQPSTTQSAKRLPKSNGSWTGEEGNSLWVSTVSKVNTITNGKGIPFRNGRVDFSEWSLGEFTIQGLNGKNSHDFALVYQEMVVQWKFKNATAAKDWLKANGITLHHENNTTIQLIPSDLNNTIPHVGAASDLRKK